LKEYAKYLAYSSALAIVATLLLTLYIKTGGK
jgi:hypothetical protein